ncbi:hypothetical protein [Mucilaginibacter auburnensis]|uniref:Uncharacterized protein n=1 Tax=Mucilaginibacter auburnensis TaxID=1457233 RepID=A0A2H9VRG5_9SPHI|nr:hypothetical protein [Mucilaginibacter auburnensis]PJJ83412.1 hypothetical protein CLV57_0394 [Mucilaginibacter auburnensis]
MTKQALIEHTVAIMNKLPEDKAAEIARFANLLMESNNKLSQVSDQLQKMRELLTRQLNELNVKRDATHLTEAPTFHIKA